MIHAMQPDTTGSCPYFLICEDCFMNKEKPSVGPLKRIVVSISAGNRPTGKEILDAKTVEFIFGLGREGLTPLERNLSGKKNGDSVTIQLEREEVPSFFGHVLLCPQLVESYLDRFYLNFRIRSVEAASPREVIRAMAQTTSCGGGCSCGCQSG